LLCGAYYNRHNIELYRRFKHLSKIERPTIKFELSEQDFVLLQKSRIYSKKYFLKILFYWMEFRLKYEIIVIQKPAKSLHCTAYLLYFFLIGFPLYLIPVYVETQIFFTPLFIKNPNFIFLTWILSVIPNCFYIKYFNNRNISAFYIPKSEYWIFIMLKVFKKGILCAFKNSFVPTCFVFYVMLCIYFFSIRQILISTSPGKK
jgi:hypothetical protein